MATSFLRQLTDPNRFELKLCLDKKELKTFLLMCQNGLGLAPQDEVVDSTNIYASLAYAVSKEMPTGLQSDEDHADHDLEEHDDD